MVELKVCSLLFELNGVLSGSVPFAVKTGLLNHTETLTHFKMSKYIIYNSTESKLIRN